MKLKNIFNVLFGVVLVVLSFAFLLAAIFHRMPAFASSAEICILPETGNFYWLDEGRAIGFSAQDASGFHHNWQVGTQQLIDSLNKESLIEL